MITPRLPDFRLETYFSKWEFAARYHLTASDAQTMTIGELLALGTDDDRAAFAELPLGYTETWGGDALRAAIADTYSECTPDDVLAFAGAEEAIFWTMQLLVGPGEHVVVTVPNYQALETVPRATGAEVTGVLLDPADGWRLDLDAVRAALRPNTRLVAVNFPNNPTGAVPDRDTWLGLVALCEERGIRLLSDEVYRGLELDRSRTLPQAADLSGTAVSINVMSKSYGLPGLRIGWVACRDRDVLAALERHKHYTSICNAGPSELLAGIALRAGERIQERNRAIIAANLPVFDAFFARHPDLFEWEPPDGGCVAFPRYLGGEGAETFARELVENVGVLVLPASIYASELATTPTDRFRIGVGRLDPWPALAAVEEFLGASARPTPSGRKATP
ncbi:aminotransferase class I/II-fold pyridoxal phosphate-dependent enzyme [Pseudonocardia sp. TRM90224]|uniref:aminotransferase class I/II-fold pyridoxal phosphate-dependent enzyme n=1 Tax=Pseudonocardia sp. TRM90224 TaxID=2812678 RepID=UPI001E3C298D|nr:aminotransferase class I/II-fold pyridoxal phosphate-dependent enzyme [Pseudonocardia sp. TRM90224]